MRISVNETSRDFPEGESATVAALMAASALPELAGVAVAVNDTVVPRTAWAAHRLAEGDRVLVIRASQGG